MLLRALLVASIAIILSVVAKADQFDGLIISGDYKKLPVVVAVSENDLITKEEVLRTVKLKLMANNITPEDWVVGSNQYLYVEISCFKDGSSFTIDICLKKRTAFYAKDSLYILGPIIVPTQGNYGSFGTGASKSFYIESLNDFLDKFLLDYLETNMAFAKTLDEYMKDRGRQRLVKILGDANKTKASP